MVRLTRDLIRKKAEHHEGILPELEEISLHQLEIEKIEVIGTLCRKLRILYLQNNIISKIENLAHCKDLEYLNVALNNIERIEGLRLCEFLNKLDLTVNFIDLDTFEESIAELRHNRMLRELYLMGNPCADWDGHRKFVAAVLPDLESLDGKAITRTERIVAKQELPSLLKELRTKAREVRRRKAEEAGLPVDEEAYTPATRLEMYREMAEEKEEKAKREKEMQPRERNAEKEHAESKVQAREKERKQLAESDDIRQCNEGRYDFRLVDEDGDGNVVVEVEIPRFIDTSLVDVDVQPRYVSIVIKNKTLRLRFDEEVRPDAGTAQRSKITGQLRLVIPKVDASRAVLVRRRMEQERLEAEQQRKKEDEEKEKARKKTQGELLLMEAGTEAGAGSAGATSAWRTIVSDNEKAKEQAAAAAASAGQESSAALWEAPFIDDGDVPDLE